MKPLDRIHEAVRYIDEHLAEPLDCEELARQAHLSPFYFQRLFNAVVGQSLAAHIRDRRLDCACRLLADSGLPLLDISLDSGFASVTAFYRAFRNRFKMPPGRYRHSGCVPDGPTTQELIIRLTNRLQGGIFVQPKMIRQGSLLIAGLSGDGSRTGELWQRFMALEQAHPLADKRSDSGYEIRVYGPDGCLCHVGAAVCDRTVGPGYTLLRLPAARYAVFEVYPALGYESENAAMDRWLADHADRWRQKLYRGQPYAVEFYDERFHGEEAGSIVEIWVPLEAVR